jgi:transcriptional regulator with XRE-family HTH domain
MLGALLKEARLAAGLTQEELAHRAGVDRSYVSQMERDLKSPTVQMLFRVCQALNASPSAIIAALEASAPRKKTTRVQ